MQIGPKIRIGGSVGKVGQNIKLAAGKAAKQAAPFVSFINPALGAGLAAAGTGLDTSHGGVSPLDIVKTGGLNYLGGKIGGFDIQPGEGVTSLSDLAKKFGGGGGGGGLGGIGDFLTGNGGMNALGIAQGVNAAQLQKKSEDFANKSLGAVEQSYNERAPLRTMGVSSIQNALKANPFAMGKPQMPLPPQAGVSPLARPSLPMEQVR